MNPRPKRYERSALTTELLTHGAHYIRFTKSCKINFYNCIILDLENIDDKIRLATNIKKMTDRQTLKFYYRAICDTTRNIRHVDVPVIRGTNSRIFIVDTIDMGRVVFRFNPRHVAHRNHDISQVLQAHNIPVPAIKLNLYQGQYFETYPYAPGQTFQECLDAGMSSSEIKDVYEMMAYQIKKMSEIPLHNFRNIENKNCSAVAQSNIVNKKNSWTLGQCVKYGTKLLNAGRQSICHCDLTPSNIVLNDDKQISSVLDLNAVSIANINFALAIAGLSLQRNKLNRYEFYSICDDVLPGRLQPVRLSITEQICELYFRGYCK